MNTPVLSIVMATWNKGELTRSCLQSLQSSSIHQEIIVVDNGSQDQTVEMIQKEFPEIRLFKNKTNKGVTAAWRKGLSQCKGTFVCISNNDVIYDQGCFVKLLHPLEKHSWVGVSCPETYMSDQEIVPVYMESSRVVKGKEKPKTTGYRVGFTGWSFTFRREDFLENFDSKLHFYYSDTDFLYHLLFRRRAGPPFRWPVLGKVPVVVEGARIEHLYHSSHNQLSKKWISWRVKKDKEWFDKKWSGNNGKHIVLKEINWSQSVQLDSSTYRVLYEKKLENQNFDMPMVSIIIPCYNHGALLRETLESVTQQTHFPLEVLIVDDGSKEDLLCVVHEGLKRFLGEWRFVQLSANSGPGVARRIGLQLSRGKYIQYLDSDDKIHSEKIAQQVKYLEDSPEKVMTYSLSCYLNNGEKEGLPRILGTTDQNYTNILSALLETKRMTWITSSCLWRKSMSNYPEFWHPLFGPEDTLFDFLMGLKNHPIGKTPGEIPLLFKRIHPESISAGIAASSSYQLEILKSYDLQWEALKSSSFRDRWRTALARRYERKVMDLLKLRRYWEVQHCLNQIRAIDSQVLPWDAWLAEKFNKLSRSFVGFGLLRRWRWIKKRLNKYRLLRTNKQ